MKLTAVGSELGRLWRSATAEEKAVFTFFLPAFTSMFILINQPFVEASQLDRKRYEAEWVARGGKPKRVKRAAAAATSDDAFASPSKKPRVNKGGTHIRFSFYSLYLNCL